MPEWSRSENGGDGYREILRREKSIVISYWRRIITWTMELMQHRAMLVCLVAEVDFSSASPAACCPLAAISAGS